MVKSHIKLAKEENVKMELSHPFCIIIDTREQRPLEFPTGVTTAAGTCYPGDYSLAGYPNQVAIERKGCVCNGGVWTSDLVSTITELLRGQSGDTERGSLRFRWELLAMSHIIHHGGIAFVATDKPRSFYESHCYRGGLTPKALFATIRSLEDDYGVPFKFYESKQQMTTAILRTFVERWKHLNGSRSYPQIPKGVAPAPFTKWRRESSI